ncbi:MAG TPA: hypothetical protein VKH44_07150 [Pirellulaceae bacterium]|nr:hypothetical protein [Pirellulaceae bacterium]
MRCRPYTVPLVAASVVMLLSIIVIFGTLIIPLGIGGWLVSLAAFWWGLPLALVLALIAAIMYFAEFAMSSKPPNRKR